jgi:phosphoribosylcarboxyaminoimidazole (NCAIR) mutase
MGIYGKLSGGDIPLPKIHPTVVAACQNMNNATLNLAKVTTLSDPNLTNAVAEYNKDCRQFIGPLNIG